MHIIFVDDEPSSHVNFSHALPNPLETHTLHCFFTAAQALTHTAQNPVDCAFLDIELRGEMSGLELARQLKEMKPHIEVVFTTAYDAYSMASYQIGGRAYLTKPYTAEQLDEALHLLDRLCQTQNTPATATASQVIPRVKMRTFGNFDVIVEGHAVPFKTAKAKEALAFLVNQMGSTVTGPQLFSALWEQKTYNTTNAVYVRRTIHALKEELQALGAEDILIVGRNCFGVDMEKFDCDSYALLQGDVEQVGLFNGEYMQQYAWSASTLPQLRRAVKRIAQNQRKDGTV